MLEKLPWQRALSIHLRECLSTRIARDIYGINILFIAIYIPLRGTSATGIKAK
jgi:hypothetical protein